MTSQTFRKLARLTALLAFAVVVLGAYVRLTDAGLGCPDWPGCYGNLGAPTSEEAIAAAREAGLLLVEGDVPAELQDKARLAASNCPEYAITITENG